LVIGHWSLVKRLRKERLSRKAGDSFAEIGLAICDLGFGVWNFSHLAVLGALGGLFFQD
jgi:hypothetical protein